MDSPERPARYAVLGNPVGHSLSPRIHSNFASQTGEALRYEAIELPLDGFEAGIHLLQNRSYSGANITVPFKREAWALCTSLSKRAKLAGAVNTLSFNPDGSVNGDNTDGLGLCRDLVDNLQVDIGGRRILVLGAGGAVRGVLGPLLEQAPASLTIANRRPEKAVSLARDFTSQGNISALAFDALGGQDFDLVINGTAAGLDNEVPAIPNSVVSATSVCYDMMYSIEKPTAFVTWALSQGVAAAFDGLGMLVEQAAAAFEIWRGVRPDSTAVIQTLRAG